MRIFGAIAFLVIISCQGFAQPAGSGLGEKVYRSLDFSALPEEFRNTCEPMLFSVRFHINDIGKMDSVEYSTNIGPVHEGFLRPLRDMRFNWQAYPGIKYGTALWVTVPVMILKDPSVCGPYPYNQVMKMMEGLRFKGGGRMGIVADGYAVIHYPAIQ